jgi:hypothetical protein
MMLQRVDAPGIVEGAAQYLCKSCQGSGRPAEAEAIEDHGRPRPAPEQKKGASQAVRVSVTGDRDMIDGGPVDSGQVENATDGLAWESHPVLDTPQPFFLERPQQDAVPDQHRGRIGLSGVQTEYIHGHDISLPSNTLRFRSLKV